MVIDLHGRRSDDAVRELTLFLERIRSAASRVPSFAASSSQFYVTVITGSGSHSTHGPILRSVVQRLLEKRGMSYQLERGGGAFRVNALSGHDLYQAEAPADSKVVVADNDSFHEMASARRRHHHHGSFADTVQMMAQQSTVTSQSSRSSMHIPSHSLSIPVVAAAAVVTTYDPLPRQVAEEDANLKTAMEKSRNETDYEARLQRRHEEELERAISASRAAAASRASSQEMIEGQQSLLQLVAERSIVDEHMRKEQAQKEFEDELLKAIEQSIQLEDRKSEEEEEAKASEEYLLQKALAASEMVKTPEDELLHQILAQSLMEQKRIEEEEQKLLQEAINNSSRVADNVNDHDSSAEDEELRRVIEMSKELF